MSSGRVVRLLADVEPRAKTARLVIGIDEPYQSGHDRHTPLLLGMFVDVTIHGRETGPVVVVPRAVLREGDVVWVVEKGRLRIQPVHVTRLTRREAWIDQGLAGGETVVATALSGVADGMPVRVQDTRRERESEP